MVMKKVFLTAMTVLMTMTAATMNAAEAATTDETQTMVNYTLDLSLREMKKALDLDYEQAEVLSETNRRLRRQVAHLGTMTAERRQEKLTTFLYENLATVRMYLNERQYRTYLSLLNAEFNETGLNGVLFGHNDYMAAE